MTAVTNIERYYQFHSKIYDATRWSFLFGREAILDQIAIQPKTILEVGCGTGHNLMILHKKFPSAEIVGLDMSQEMLDVAQRKAQGKPISFVHQPYDQPVRGTFDLILCSYSLTMFNPGWDAAIQTAWRDLAPHGQLAVVDFHRSQWPFFTRWMDINHVRMDGHLLPKLNAQFKLVTEKVNSAYLGLWHYFLYIGEK